jgi:hypothetical protein
VGRRKVPGLASLTRRGGVLSPLFRVTAARKHPLRFALPAAILLVALGTPLVRAAGDPGWPREIQASSARILMYQPQLEALEKDQLTGRAAVSVKTAKMSEPVFGTVWLSSRVEIDRDKRSVGIFDVKVPKVRFPNATPEQEQALTTVLEREIPKWDLTLSLDRLIAALEVAQREQATTEKFNETPPRVLRATEPTLLVTLDGEPKQIPVPDSGIQRVVNTPFFIVYDRATGRYFLAAGNFWYAAREAAGPWESIPKAPQAVEDFYKREQKSPPETEGEAPAPKPAAQKNAPPPKVIVTTVPSELILSDGEPKYASVAGTGLLYMSNTENRVLMDTATQRYYLLLSGRWFAGSSLDGPWEFVRPDALPEEFKKIPENSAVGDVLSHVAGTEQAEEALMDALVPQTNAVKRSEARTEVVYDGEPRFKAIPDTGVEYAVNTSSQVLKIGGKYYACDQAIWFVGDSPRGPWAVADSVPAEVQQIPPDSPVYNTKYVYVYDSTPDVVYVGYLPGYVGCYPYYGAVVYGTGYPYSAWVGSVYYPMPVTYGFHAAYNPYYGWGFGFGVGFMVGNVNISIGMWGTPYGWWGPAYYPPMHAVYGGYGGYYGGGPGYAGNPGNPNRPGKPGAGQPRPTPYAGASNNLYNRPENRGRNAASTSDRGARPSAPAARNSPNNVYSDRSGNVYRQSGGGWQQNGKSGWSSSSPSQGTSSLNRDAAARQQGSARMQGYSGGAARGGGGHGGRR